MVLSMAETQLHDQIVKSAGKHIKELVHVTTFRAISKKGEITIDLCDRCEPTRDRFHFEIRDASGEILDSSNPEPTVSAALANVKWGILDTP